MSKISDERREVARRLRKTRVERYNSILNGIHLGEIVGVGAQIVSPHEDQVRAAADRLADLIDPQERTCHISDTDHEYEDSVRCDACHMTFNRPWEPFKFCPNCGARVVSDDD